MKLNAQEIHLIKTAGYDPHIANECTQDEVLRMKEKGASIYVPMLLAFIGMYLTVWYTTQNVIASGIGGLIWAFIIYRIDKALMVTADSGFSWSTVFRVLLAILNSIVVAECIVALVFSDTINEQQAKSLAVEHEKIEQLYQTRIADLNKAMDVEENKIAKLRNSYVTELDGSGGAGNRGYGKVSIEKKRLLDEAEIIFDQYKLDHDNNVNKLTTAKTAQVKSLNDNQAKAISGKLKALHEVDDPYIFVAAMLIRLLLLAIEMMPMFLKYSKKKETDLYDSILQMQSKGKKEEYHVKAKETTEINKARLKFVSTIGKRKAAYQNAQEEIEIHHNFINEMMMMRSEQAAYWNSQKKKNKNFDQSAADSAQKTSDRIWNEKVEQDYTL